MIHALKSVAIQKWCRYVIVALKGQIIKAQGNALGFLCDNSRKALKGRVQITTAHFGNR